MGGNGLWLEGGGGGGLRLCVDDYRRVAQNVRPREAPWRLVGATKASSRAQVWPWIGI